MKLFIAQRRKDGVFEQVDDFRKAVESGIYTQVQKIMYQKIKTVRCDIPKPKTRTKKESTAK